MPSRWRNMAWNAQSLRKNDLPLLAINLIWEIEDDAFDVSFFWTIIQSQIEFAICRETYQKWELDTADGKKYSQVLDRMIAEMESRSKWRKIVTKCVYNYSSLQDVRNCSRYFLRISAICLQQ